MLEDINKEARDNCFNFAILIDFMKILFYLILVVAFLYPAIALEIQVYSITFDVNPDMIVREEIKIVFSDYLEQGNLTYMINGNVYDVKANNSYEDVFVKKEQDRLVLFVPNKTKQLYLSFETRDVIKQYNDGKEFLTYLYLPNAKLTKIQLWLPKGYVLYKDGVMPKGEIGTDGERIFVSWKGYGSEVPLIVRFYQANQSKTELFLALVFAATAIIVFFKIKRSDDYLLGFSNDEIKVIETVKAKRIVYQNKLEKELGFSRAKMTRIMKKLEEKGLIEREKIGRTNKIKWK